jgi:hypothetical protein
MSSTPVALHVRLPVGLDHVALLLLCRYRNSVLVLSTEAYQEVFQFIALVVLQMRLCATVMVKLRVCNFSRNFLDQGQPHESR